jgi:outer membrane receptor for ferrienterochelin and colicin
MRRHVWLAAMLVLVAAATSFAQGTQTGTLSGTVLSPDKLPLPGVSVSISSPALLGVRTVVTDQNGGYIFKALPNGTYKVSYQLSGFATIEKSVAVALGNTVPLDVTLAVASVQEAVTVTAETPTPLSTTQVGANLAQQTVDTLATGRNIQAVALLAPGVTDKTPNAGQVTISGSFAYDNVFLVDGTDINDNLFGTPTAVFIEDAIDETQVLTGGISAEYGRFSGGVINAVTKRGSNNFSGSFRANLSNPAWRDETPYEKQQNITRDNKLSEFYEATLGGPIVKDRLWFFAAGRKESSETVGTTFSGISFNSPRDQKRAEIKLSGAVTPNHTLQATYTKVWDDTTRLPFGTSVDLDPAHQAVDAQQPADLFSASYHGVLKSNLFVEAQYSRKTFSFVNLGGSSKDIVDSPYLSETQGFYAYNAPYFDASDPEDRNNQQFTAALSYYLTTSGFGKHDLKVGYEHYTSTRTGGNSQSSTDYVFYTDFLEDPNGKPVFDSNGYVIPVFTNGLSQLQNWQAVRGAQVDLTTQAVFLNDHWTLGSRWAFNVGVRAEWEGGNATGGIQPISASRIVPRLGASFDVLGNGKFKLDATYSQYAGKISETQFANNTNVGNPNAIYYQYTGPDGQGRSFAPGIDPKNYTEIIGGVFPTANVFYAPNIKSPVTKEWTAAAGLDLGQGGYVKAIYTHRFVTDFVQQFINTSTGTTHVVVGGVDYGTFSNRLWDNTTDGERKYDGLQFIAAYPITHRWNIAGNYTLQINNDGNQEGEATNQPGAPSLFPGYYPELFNEARSYPIGPLNGYQKHRGRIWTTYDWRLGKAGDLNFGLLYRGDSGQAYSIRSTGRPLTSVQRAIGNALYPDLPTTQTIFYSLGRGSETYEGANLFDLAITYSIPVYKSASLWVKGECRNMFDSTPLISYNITVTPDPNSPKDALGIPTGYIKGPNFGKGTTTANYPFPREYFLTLGFRF